MLRPLKGEGVYQSGVYINLFRCLSRGRYFTAGDNRAFLLCRDAWAALMLFPFWDNYDKELLPSKCR